MINGASGGVGSYAVQIAKHYKAEVWGTCSGTNFDFIESIGVDHALDCRLRPLNQLDEKFDIILDAVSNSSFGECSGILTPKGAYITLLPSLRFVAGKLRSLFSARKCAVCVIHPRTGDLAEIASMIDAKAISTPVASSFPMAELKTALEKLAAGGVRGKIGIVVEN